MLNPKDYHSVLTIIGSFQGGAAGKLQLGAAWWFNDHKEGIEAQLKAVASQGLLGGFTGMVTDSRSFLSYVRHEYFRRILCNLIGALVDGGESQRDNAILKKLVENICYYKRQKIFRAIIFYISAASYCL